MIAHVIILDGQIVGGWRRTLTKNAVILERNLLTDLTRSEERALAQEADRYSEFLQLPVEMDVSMTKYVAFLRAINVGGNAIIKMADLKQMFESAGLENVQTYIQSGNVIFESEEENIDALEKRIESQLEGAAGYKIHLFVRTMRELAIHCE